MGGKGNLLLVAGFTMLFLVFGHHFGRLSTDSVDNAADYFEETTAHNLAVSGANIALNEIFQDQTWAGSANYQNLSFAKGIINVSIADNAGEKVLNSTGTFQGISKTVSIRLKPSNYAKFAWYIGNMSSKEFITGDTVWGPFHTQSKLNIGGDPVFWGKVTTLRGLSPSQKKMQQKGYDPKFYGGYESGIDIPLPNNYQFTSESAMALDGVNNYGGASYFDGTDVWLTFNSDGTVTYRTGTGSDSSTYSAPITTPLTTFAPTGVIYVKKGEIYLSGTLNGKVTVVAGESSGMGHGNVYLWDDITYTTDPMVWDANENKYVPNENCTDMMGLLATNNVIIADNDHNVDDEDIRVDASIFCAQGGFQMENVNIPPSGSLFLRGGVVAAKEEIVSVVNNGGHLTNGYKKHVIFDERFMLSLPPTFPGTGKLEIISWLE